MSGESDDSFFILCRCGSYEDLRTWLDERPQFKINQPQSSTGNTGLHFAALSSHDSKGKTEFLVNSGANPSVRNDVNETPAHNAARIGNLEALKVLVEKGGLSGILMGNLHTRDTKTRGSRSRQNSRKKVWAAPSKTYVASMQAETSCKNILQTACEAKNTEIVEYLIDEIMKARKSCLHECIDGDEAPVEQKPKATFRHTLDIREFLSFTIPRQVVFFELGFDLASSNCVQTMKDMEESIYGLMLRNTPKAFRHLLNSCIFTIGRTTYVDFLPFFNPQGGSELSILRIIIHYKQFELLTHPLCELFLHLKGLRSRSFYWISIFANLIFTCLTLAYIFLSFTVWAPMERRDEEDVSETNGNETNIRDELKRKDNPLFIPLIGMASFMALLSLAKMVQDRALLLSWDQWKHRIEDILAILVLSILILDACMWTNDEEDEEWHNIFGAIISFGSCRMFFYVMTRSPEFAITTEMFDFIKKNVLKSFINYSFLIIGYTMAFHILMHSIESVSSFGDPVVSLGKVLSMFTGDLGFDQVFGEVLLMTRPSQTDSDGNPNKEPLLHEDYSTSIFVLLLYVFFVYEMCVILMNLTIALSISNIQDMRKNANGLRLVKEVMLQRYLESLLRLFSIPLCSGLWKDSSNMGQFVLLDIYNCNAFYTLKNTQQTNFEGMDQQMTLMLMQKECQMANPLNRSDEKIPPRIAKKINRLLSNYRNEEQQDDNAELKGFLMDMNKLLHTIQGDLQVLKEEMALLAKSKKEPSP